MLLVNFNTLWFANIELLLFFVQTSFQWAFALTNRTAVGIHLVITISENTSRVLKAGYSKSRGKFNPAQSRQESLSIVCVPRLRCRDGPLGVPRLERCLFSRVNDSCENHTRPTCSVQQAGAKERHWSLHILIHSAPDVLTMCSTFPTS